MKYFENFPTISYDGQQVKDITRRNSFTSLIATNPFMALPYTVREGERPEDIANFYYGSTDYTWLVYFSNNIIDPYIQWPMSEADWNAYMAKKYAKLSGRIGDEVVEWTRSDDDDNIIYYYKEV